MQLLTPGATEHNVAAGVAAFKAGRPVVLTDDSDDSDGDTDDGHLVFAAEHATPALVAFAVRHGSGFLCVALPEADCDRLALPPMWQGDRSRTSQRVTVDALGTGTGISAAARAQTITALAAPDAVIGDFVRPGHVVPVAAHHGGVLARRRHTEAAVDLARLAGLSPAGALCSIVSQEHPGAVARGSELSRFAAEHGLVCLSVAELVEHRRRTEPQVVRAATTSMPTVRSPFQAVGYRGVHDTAEHVALVAGTIGDGWEVPVHVHRECLSGDILGAAVCGCRRALDEVMQTFATQGRGVVIYLRPLGTARTCGSPVPLDEWSSVAWILTDLGVRSVQQPGPEPARIDEWVPARPRRAAAALARIAG
jgi:3,4-dihydroxy 2-butanone 4-phosphate synthase / GTP cyclohydrolase II